MIRVVSWNVLADAYVRRGYYPDTPQEVFDRARRRKAVVSRIETYAQAEVICLQECDSALFSALETTLSESTGKLFRKRGRGEGCAIFVRNALTTEPAWREVVFSDLSGHIALGVTFAGITVVTTHLKWQPLGASDDDHCGRKQLSDLLDAWPSGARIVCGDFNDEPSGPVLALASTRGLVDAHARSADGFTCVANGERKRIDFLLHTADFGATPSPLPSVSASASRSEPGDDRWAMPSASEPSDHVPIDARFER